jgi:hypothetical protein
VEAQAGEAGETNAGERRCPGCGVSIFPGQKACGFCQRQATQQATREKKRFVTLGVALGLLLTAGAGAALWGLQPWWRKAEVAPEPKHPPPVFVEVTSADVRIDGHSVWPMPPRADQMRTGLVNRNTPGGDAWKAAIESGIRVAARQQPHAGGVVEMKVPPDTPAMIIDQLLDARGKGNGGHLSVEASTFGPASTLLILSESTKTDPVALSVQVRHHSVALALSEDGEYKDVGVGCVVSEKDGTGTGFMLRRPEDYMALQACLTALRARIPAGEPAHPRLRYYGSIPASKVIYVANLLRCGEQRCAENAPRLWDVFNLSSTSDYGSLLNENGPPLVLALQPALHQCFTALRAQLPEPSYETEVVISTKDNEGSLLFNVRPGLPPPLEACVTQALHDAHFTVADLVNGQSDRFPIVFGD